MLKEWKKNLTIFTKNLFQMKKTTIIDKLYQSNPSQSIKTHFRQSILNDKMIKRENFLFTADLI